MIRFTDLTEEEQNELLVSQSLHNELVANYLAEVSASLNSSTE
jgi:hypothetical protein